MSAHRELRLEGGGGREGVDLGVLALLAAGANALLLGTLLLVAQSAFLVGVERLVGVGERRYVSGELAQGGAA